MGNNANIADNITFSKDQLFAFARDAIIGHGMLGANAPGMSEQLWAGLKDSRKPAFADDIRDSFDEYVTGLGKSAVAKKLAGWKKGSPLSARLSNCRKIAEWTTANPDRASEVYALESLKLAYAFVNKAKKGDAAPTGGDGDPAETVPATVEVEANADSGDAILIDLLEWLAKASLEDRLYMVTELEKITGSSAYRTA